nr:DNA-deirected RNA polymerases I and III 16kDa polypeptide [Cryptomonas curvata]
MNKLKILIKTSNYFTLYTFYNEDHTLGNILKYIISTNPLVEYISYNVPYPSENIMYLKICSKNNEKSNQLILGLKNANEMGILIDNLFSTKIELRNFIF